MSAVTATIDVHKPANSRIVGELDKHNRKTYTHQEVWSKMEKKMNDFYGSNLKLNINPDL